MTIIENVNQLLNDFKVLKDKYENSKDLTVDDALILSIANNYYNELAMNVFHMIEYRNLMIQVPDEQYVIKQLIKIKDKYALSMNQLALIMLVWWHKVYPKNMWENVYLEKPLHTYDATLLVISANTVINLLSINFIK